MHENPRLGIYSATAWKYLPVTKGYIERVHKFTDWDSCITPGGSNAEVIIAHLKGETRVH